MTCAVALSLIAKPLSKHTFLPPFLNGDPFIDGATELSGEMLPPSGHCARLMFPWQYTVVFPWLKQLLEFECPRIRIVMVNVVKRPEPAGIKRATSTLQFIYFFPTLLKRAT